MHTKPEKFNAQQVIDAIQNTGGIVSAIAKNLGCEWHTVQKYIEKYPTIKAAWDAERNKVDDLAESVLVRAMQGDTPDLGTAKWWLAKRRRKEWGESLDLTTDGGPLKITIAYEGEQQNDGS